ncbi:L-2-amino-thiazoline-4-carboxylic acid hydrolase [Domibacillus aminovorans]|nr:L-2-amino-thiazoline-4-carboxylic acid hydrolase [Domibacillus aminovorans]
MENIVKKGIDNLDPVSMYTITAKLFTHVLMSVTERFSGEGKIAIEAGVKRVTDEQVLTLKKQMNNPEEEINEGVLFHFDRLLDDEKVEETFRAYEKAQKEVGLEAHTMYAMMAKVFANVAKCVVDKFGEAGQEAMMNGVGTFGEERGRDIARRAAAVGKPNTMDNYLSNYDMGRSELFEYETLFHPTEIEQSFTKCAFAEQWKQDGMEDYGILYCHMIDPSIAKGYNPNFEVVHDQYVLKEGTCHFRFQMKEEV